MPRRRHVAGGQACWEEAHTDEEALAPGQTQRFPFEPCAANGADGVADHCCRENVDRGGGEFAMTMLAVVVGQLFFLSLLFLAWLQNSSSLIRYSARQELGRSGRRALECYKLSLPALRPTNLGTLADGMLQQTQIRKFVHWQPDQISPTHHLVLPSLISFHVCHF